MWFPCNARARTHRCIGEASRAVYIVLKWMYLQYTKVEPVHVACYHAMYQRRNNAGVIEYFEGIMI